MGPLLEVAVLAWRLAMAPGAAIQPLQAAEPPLSAAEPNSAAVPAIESRSGRFLVDVGVATASSAAIAFGKSDIRRALQRDARLSNVFENFAHPVRQIRLGTQRDSDPFWVNNVAHPGLFALEALYLKRRGYGNGSAFLFTQVHSVLWEFAVEGSAFEPSGKDLVADAAGAALGIWVLHPVAARASQRIADGRGRVWDHVARWLDPVSGIAGRRGGAVVTVQPTRLSSGFGLQLAATF